eukprot:scaffold99608_cov19-Tisochrysis_lutea.AAC.1
MAKLRKPMTPKPQKIEVQRCRHARLPTALEPSSPPNPKDHRCCHAYLPQCPGPSPAWLLAWHFVQLRLLPSSPSVCAHIYAHDVTAAPTPRIATHC